MPEALSSGNDSSGNDSPQALRLGTFIKYAAPPSTAGTLLVLTLAGIYAHPGLLVMGLVLAVNLASLLWAWRRLRHNHIQQAAVTICAGVWAISIAVAFLVDVPILSFPLLLVLSVMAALPYVTRRTLLRLIRGATLLAVAITPLAFWLRKLEAISFTLKGDIVPEWLLAAIIIVIVPTIIGLILLLLWQHGTQLAQTLAESQRANQALKESERALELKVQELQESRARVVTVQEGVRRDIASHLHGRVQGRLLVLKGMLGQNLSQLGHLPEVARSLTEASNELDQVLEQELRNLAQRLYPSILRRGLAPAFRSLCAQFQEALTVEVQISEELIEQDRTNRNFLPEPVRLAAYRIAQEALTNVVKHSRASVAAVRLELLQDGKLRLAVKDDGKGFDSRDVIEGLGTAVMRDYAAALGGDCVVRSAPGVGTEVTALLPITQAIAAQGASEDGDLLEARASNPS